MMRGLFFAGLHCQFKHMTKYQLNDQFLSEKVIPHLQIISNNIQNW